MLGCFMIYELQKVDKSMFPSSLVRMIYEYTELYKARKDPQLAEEAQIFMPRFRSYHAGRLCRLVNYSREALPARLWCEVENKFWFFMTKVFRHFIWKPKVRALLEEARALAALCHARNVPFVVDDNVEVALAAGADGVHVGQSDMAARRARALLGPDKILGVSAHNAAEALAAQADGADYLGCGAAFVTGTKLDAHPVTAETMRAVTAAVNIPVVAIGGIEESNILQLQGRGLAGVAVVSAIFAAQDPEAASRRLYELSGQL